jgi:colanic acid/amylovoran biosynthesis glycosyltransferase
MMRPWIPWHAERCRRLRPMTDRARPINQASQPAGGGRGIAYVASVFPTYSETFVYREVVELRRRGWRVEVCSLNAPTPAEMRGLAELQAGVLVVYASAASGALRSLAECLAHPFRATSTLCRGFMDACRAGERVSPAGRAKIAAQAFMSLGLARQLRRREVRHIHCHFAHAPTTVGMYAARQLGATFSFTGHANDLFQRRILLKEKLRRAAFVSCISRWHQELYQSICAGAQRYRVIRCGVDTGQWSPSYLPQRPPMPLRVVSVCRLVPKKGVDLLVRSLHAYGQSHGRTWELSVIGDGPQAEALRGLAQELGCADAVRFLGSQQNQAIRAELAKADLFGLLCRVDRAGDQDGIPVALMEAMACGIPVLTGDIAPIRELVTDGETGFCADSENLPAVVSRLKWIEDHPQETSAIAAQGRRRVEEEFSLAANVDKLEAGFRTALAGSEPEAVESVPGTDVQQGIVQ